MKQLLEEAVNQQNPAAESEGNIQLLPQRYSNMISYTDQ